MLDVLEGEEVIVCDRCLKSGKTNKGTTHYIRLDEVIPGQRGFHPIIQPENKDAQYSGMKIDLCKDCQKFVQDALVNAVLEMR